MSLAGLALSLSLLPPGAGAMAGTSTAIRAWGAGTFEPAPAAPVVDPGRFATAAPGVPSAALRSPSPASTPERNQASSLPAPASLRAGQPGPYSGLPWHSGAACGDSSFAAWRGRKLDMTVGWAPQGSWSEYTNYAAGLHWLAAQPAGFSVGLPMLPKSAKGQFDKCAHGAFDGYYRKFAQSLKGLKMGDTVIRIGWEANGDWFPWSAVNHYADYKACFARIASTFRSVSTDFKIEWPMAKKGRIFPVTQIYPGDGAVDYVGISYYDRYPSHTTQAIWDQQVNATLKGGPYGIAAWMNFARAHGKHLAVAEWGVNKGYRMGKQGVAGDTPIYIANMFNFFKTHSSGMAYEDYFNCNHPTQQERYVIYPATWNPKAAAAYQTHWRSGR